MKWISGVIIFLLLLSAPFLGVYYAVTENANKLDYKTQAIKKYEQPSISLETLGENMDSVQEEAKRIEETVADYIETFSGQSVALEAEIERSKGQQDLSDDIYERRITSVLGEPIRTHRSPQVEIKLFELNELDYRGFMAKVKLFDPSAFQVALAGDKVGGFETTSAMAKRNRAMLAINGGGFGSSKNEGKYVSNMIGGTVVGGEVIQSFIVKDEPLFFAGIDHSGAVVGTIPKSQEDVDALNPKEGLSFIPILLQDGEMLEIPGAWKNTRHPRTILGRYANDDLLLIVIDGRQAYWSKGATLERIQEKLQAFGVQDAYNLDGGGSSTIYFNGQVLNKPSDGNERPIANAIIIKP